MSWNCYLILLFARFRSWGPSWPRCSWVHIRRKMGNSRGSSKELGRGAGRRSLLHHRATPGWSWIDFLCPFIQICRSMASLAIVRSAPPILAYLLFCLCYKSKHLFFSFLKAEVSQWKYSKQCFLSSRLVMAPTNSLSPTRTDRHINNWH